MNVIVLSEPLSEPDGPCTPPFSLFCPFGSGRSPSSLYGQILIGHDCLKVIVAENCSVVGIVHTHLRGIPIVEAWLVVIKSESLGEGGSCHCLRQILWWLLVLLGASRGSFAFTCTVLNSSCSLTVYSKPAMKLTSGAFCFRPGRSGTHGLFRLVVKGKEFAS